MADLLFLNDPFVSICQNMTAITPIVVILLVRAKVIRAGPADDLQDGFLRRLNEKSGKLKPRREIQADVRQ